MFHVKGLYQGNPCRAYIKAARQKGAAIQHEVHMLQTISAFPVPAVLDAGTHPVPFDVTSELPGQRLSVIVGENKDLASLSYMEEYGEALGKLHQLTVNAPSVMDRTFFHRPSEEQLHSLNLDFLNSYFDIAPDRGEPVFCHGDFHYANILWQNHHISGILDFELCGYGNREFNIAWAMLLRPGQKFLKTEAEQEQFLQGYSRFGTYNYAAVQYYMAQCYVYFLSFSQDDTDYCEYVRNWLHAHCASVIH